MKKAPLIVALAALCAGGIGIGIATTFHRFPPSGVVSPSSPLPTVTPSASVPPVVTSPPATSPAPSPSDNFSHQRLTFRDEVKTSAFAPFRDRARAAIKRRDVQFMESVLPKKGIALGFGATQTIRELNLDNPNEPLWSILEKAMSGPCSLTNVNSEQDADGFVCSNAAGELEKQYPPPKGTQGVGHLLSKVIIEGENVNVRAQPSANSAIVARLSNEVVQLDRKTFEQRYGDTKNRYDPIKSWTPIILPNGKSGYVSSQYAHQPLEYRVIFAKVAGNWQLTGIPGGD